MAKAKNSTRKTEFQTPAGLVKAQRKIHFKDFEALSTYSKKLVYLIVRLREENGQTRFQNLGTGFLIGPHRMMTCFHCIIDRKNEAVNPMASHRDGDIYLMLQKDEHGDFHRVGIIPKLDEDLFLFEDVDTAVFYLNDDFYRVDGEYYKHPHLYLELASENKKIGSEMGIIGYPFPELSFNAKGEVDHSSVLIRVDKGVINAAYSVDAGTHVYEFTTAFNPGNSGGPILDMKTGTVIGMVHGFRARATSLWLQDEVPPSISGKKEAYKAHHQYWSTYSIGIASRSLLPLAQDHHLAVR